MNPRKAKKQPQRTRKPPSIWEGQANSEADNAHTCFEIQKLEPPVKKLSAFRS